MTTHPDHTDVTHSTEQPDEYAEKDAKELGELRWVDPTSLVIGLNTRVDVELDPHFCRDIADRGVRELITVRVDDAGRLVVRKGQRRTLAACKAGLPFVCVFIEPEQHTGADNADGEIARIVDQYGENFHRAPITEADAVNVHQQLLDLGLSAGQIARRTHTPSKRVRAIHAVTTSSMARAALSGVGGPPLRLDHAAVVAEFDDDAEDSAEAVETLLEAAEDGPGQFEHLAQRLRDGREERRLVAEHAEALAGQGVRVLSDEEAADATQLDRLRPTVDSPQGTDLTAEEHTSCPGHAVHLAMRTDWSTKQKRIEAGPYCTEPDRHAPRYNRDTDGSGPALELTEEQAEAAKEEKRAERRRVIANNRAWESATAQRRRWLTEFVSRKKPAAGAAGFIALTLAAGSHDVRKAMESGSPTACSLLGLPEPPGYYTSGPRPLVEAAKTATGVRATQVSLAVLLGAYEDGTSRESWRSPTRETLAYFTALRDWGYPLSDVEHLVLDPDADQNGGPEETDEDEDQDDDDDASARVGDDTEEPA